MIEAVQETSVLIQSSNERFFACRIFVHQGKIKHGNEKSGLCDPKLIICVGEFKVETQVINGSLSPVWNQTFIINDVKLLGVPREDASEDLPSLMLVLYDENKTSSVSSLKDT